MPQPWRPPDDDHSPKLSPRRRRMAGMDHTGGKKDSQFCWSIAWAIMARVEAGETVRSITADPAMPSYATLYHWLRVHPEFGGRYRALRFELAAQKVQAWENRRLGRAFWGPHMAKVDGRKWWPRGRSSYTHKVGKAICRRLTRGETMMSINADPAMPSAKVVYRWLKNEPAFREMVMAARREHVSRLLWRRDGLVDRAEPENLAVIKAQVAAVEGRIGRITPKVWGRP